MTPQAKRSSGRIAPREPTNRQRAAACLVHRLVLAVAATRHFRLRDPHDAASVVRGQPVIFATWHNRLALSLIIYRRMVVNASRDRRMAALVSASRDGAFLSAVLEQFEVQPVRGSSSRRGPQALLEMTSWADQGFDLAITPDGPRGPRYQVQSGIIALARITRRPIIAVVCNTRWRFGLASWDRFQVPLPFGPCEIAVASPMIVDQEDDDGLEAARRDLEGRMLSLTRD